MSITYGDNLKHNNPLFPIVDIEDVKGGIRTIATFSSYNTAIGERAGYLSTTSDGIGSWLALTQSSDSVFIGSRIRPVENQNNQIVIGYGATGSGSNSVTLGASTITKTQLRGTINIGNVPQYASNGAAITAGLVPGDIYQTLSNVLMVVI